MSTWRGLLTFLNTQLCSSHLLLLASSCIGVICLLLFLLLLAQTESIVSTCAHHNFSLSCRVTVISFGLPYHRPYLQHCDGRLKRLCLEVKMGGYSRGSGTRQENKTFLPRIQESLPSRPSGEASVSVQRFNTVSALQAPEAASMQGPFVRPSSLARQVCSSKGRLREEAGLEADIVVCCVMLWRYGS